MGLKERNKGGRPGEASRPATESLDGGGAAAAGLGVSGFVAGADDDAELLNPGAGGFLEHDLQGGFRFSVFDPSASGAARCAGGAWRR
jgi:hypothetical protein